MTSYICLAASHAPQLFKTITALPLEHHQLSPCTRSSPTAPNMLLFFYHIELPAVAPSPLTTIPFLSTPFSNTPIKGFNISLPLLPLFPFLWNQTDLAFPCPTPWMSSYQGHQWPHCQTRRPILRLYRLWNNYHCFLKTLATQWDSIPSWLPSHPMFQPISVSSLSSPHLPSFHFVFSIPFILPWQVTWSLRTWDKNFALFCYFTEKFLT